MAGADFSVATFDCYGTLVDWEGGAGSFLYQLALRHGDPTPARPRSCASAGRRSSSGCSRARTARTSEILADSLRRWTAERGYPGTTPTARRWFARCAPGSRSRTPARRCSRRRRGGCGWSSSRTPTATSSSTRCGTWRSRSTTSITAAGLPGVQAVARRLRAGAGAASASRPSSILHVAFGFKYDIAPGPGGSAAGRPGSTGHAEAPPGPARPTTSGATSGVWPSW